MKHRGILMVFLFQIAHANAATGSDFWKGCPGPACPARGPDSKYSIPEKSGEEYERIDLEDLRKERERYEKEIKNIEREERKRNN